MKTSNRYTVDIEIPRFFITIPITAENWGEALAKASLIKPLEYISFKYKAECMDHATPTISVICHQD